MDEKMNILLVDDQPAKLLTYEAVLSELGENLIKAHSGMEALEKLLKNEIALVLMDVSILAYEDYFHTGNGLTHLVCSVYSV
jgi:CheY-like chemotaxis protein